MSNIKMALLCSSERIAFASWNYQITRMFALGDWVDSLFALYFGIALPFTIFVVGVDFSNYIISVIDSRLSSGRRQPNTVLPHNDSTPNTNASLTTAPISDGYDPEVDPETDPDSDLRYAPSPQSGQPSGVQSQTNDTNGQHTSPPPDGDRNKTLGQGRRSPSSPRQQVEAGMESDRAMIKISAIITLVGTLVLFCGTLSGVVVGAVNSSRRRNWASVALAPLGATLRWALATRYNRTVPNGGFPMGTFIANITATLIDFIIGAVRIHRTHSHDVEILLSATITGFAGSLSTVSTWINEAVNMTPDKRYIYLILTVAVSQVLGIVIYGSAYWVRLANR